MTTYALPAISAAVRSVLGDTRVAQVNPGDGFPWFNCPFCGYAVYAGDPCPDHVALDDVSRDGICRHPWCIANPAMPVDAARITRGEAILREMTDAERRRNHFWAMQRIEDNRAAEAEQRREQIAEATRRGACVACLFQSGRVKFIRHRGACPRARATAQ